MRAALRYAGGAVGPVRKLPQRVRYHVRKVAARTASSVSIDEFDPEFRILHDRCAPCTMTSIERMFALHESINYLHRARIPGTIVECGVWRGGSSMLAALTLINRGEDDRGLYLFDTFTGMPEPGPEDGPDVHAKWVSRSQHSNGWARSPIEDVRRNMLSTGLREDQFTLIEGRVEETLPQRAPALISLLRLDTDFYESTLHELSHLYPRLAVGGVLIIDDYGAFDGARRAVDEYFANRDEHLLLARIDRDARIAVKRA